MSRFLEGDDRDQHALLPPSIEDYVGEDNPAHVINAYVAALDLSAAGFDVTPAKTGRPAAWRRSMSLPTKVTSAAGMLSAARRWRLMR